MSEAADGFPAGAVLAGKLRVVRRIGSGGMGEVYEVEHTLTHHRRALKLLHGEMGIDPAVVERFLREASAAGRIGNPHIVETFDAGYLESGEPYIVMELLSGKTLAALLQERGALSLDRACAILEQVADGVAAAHAAGIVHRDLKPENIFLTGSEHTFVKLLDFGISKFDPGTTGVPDLTLEGAPIGTPYYMAPEQVRGDRSVDARADVYALGVVFYECLTGRKPFVAETLPHLAVLIHEGKYDPPTAVRQGLPAAVDGIVARAMASDPAERYARAQDFAVQLGRLREAVAPLAHGRAQPAVTPPSPAPMPGTLTPAAGTRGAEPARKPTSLGVPVVAASLAALGGVAFFTLRPNERAPMPEPPVVPSATVRRSEPAVPAPSADSTAADAVAAPAPSAPPAGSFRSRRLAAPIGSTRPVANPERPSRASQVGLSETNPFD